LLPEFLFLKKMQFSSAKINPEHTDTYINQTMSEPPAKRTKREKEEHEELKYCRPSHDKCYDYMRHLSAMVNGMYAMKPRHSDGDCSSTHPIRRVEAALDAIQKIIDDEIEHYNSTPFEDDLLIRLHANPSGMTAAEAFSGSYFNSIQALRDSLKYMEQEGKVRHTENGEDGTALFFAVSKEKEKEEDRREIRATPPTPIPDLSCVEERLRPLAEAVYRRALLRPGFNDEPCGIPFDAIEQACPDASKKDLRAALDALVGEGIIYSTIDEDHFKIA